KVKEIRLSQSKIVGDIGESFNIDTTILPSYSYNKMLRWISSNNRIAKVDQNGNITLVGKGICRITVSAAYGENSTKRIIYVFSGYTFDSAHYRQGDPTWRFGEFAERACVVTSMAILATNATNETITPRNIKNLGGNLDRIEDKYNLKAVCALPEDSGFIKTYDAETRKTTVINPRKNGEAAIREAMRLHPEGVCCYFVGRGGKHMVVAIGFDEDGTIYYSDPGREAAKGFEVPLKQTWCGVGHGFGYGQLNYMLAFDQVNN
ncbi:MAG: Ig-like domain-containing protein, partial [Clostridia bacterium]|nr:Ig-like domain-containing protein [Clostridia bacterium]